MLDKAQQKEKKSHVTHEVKWQHIQGNEKNVLNNKMAHPNSWRMTGGDGVGKG